MSRQTPLLRSKHRTLAGGQRNHMNHYVVIQIFFPSSPDSFKASEGWIYCHSYFPFATHICRFLRRRLYSWSRPSRQPGRKSRLQSESTIAGQVPLIVKLPNPLALWSKFLTHLLFRVLDKVPNPLAPKANDAGHLSCCCCCDRVVWMLMRSFSGLDKHCVSDKISITIRCIFLV